MSVAKISSSSIANSITTYQPSSSFVPLLKDLKIAKSHWTLDERKAFWAQYGDKIAQIFPQKFLVDLDFVPTDLFQKIVRPHIVAMQKSIYCAMPTTNDFGTSVRKLRFTGPVKDKFHIEYLVANMKKIADTEGFELLLSELFIYLRDHCVRLENGKIVFSTANEALVKHVPKAIERSMSKGLYYQENAMGCTRHSLFWSTLGSTLAGHEESRYDYAQHHGGKSPEEFLFYFEGGNVLTLTNQQGKRKIFMGKGHLPLIHANWRLAGLFEHKEIVKKSGGIKPEDIAKIQSSLTDAKTKEVAEEMYALGLIKNGEGFIGTEKLSTLGYSIKNPLPPRTLAVNAGLIKPFELTAAELAGMKPLAAKFLAQREFILKLLSANFYVPIEDIHFIPEAAYHLDTFMMPGPNRTIFIQDYELCGKLLLNLHEQAATLSLTEQDQKILRRYITMAALLHIELRGLLKEAKAEIVKAGFAPIPTPGFFPDAPNSKGETFNVQFLNAISGWSLKNKRPYLITTGAQVGDRLGKALMNLFETFVKQYQPDLQVHFVGYKPDAPADFSAAMRWWNGPKESTAHAGVHCMSFEEDAAGHAYISAPTISEKVENK